MLRAVNAIAAVITLFLCIDVARAQNSIPSALEENVIARVGDLPPITSEELDRAVNARVVGTFGSSDADRARSTVLQELIKERLAEELVTEEAISASPDLANALDEARRQVLLKYYLFKNVSVASPTLEDIKSYIESNPDIFEGRRTYHYTEIIITLPRETGTNALLGKIQDAVRVSNPTPESLRMLCDWMDGMEITYGYSKLWQSSEQIAPDMLKILQALDGSERKVKLEKVGSEYRVIVLHGSFADPLDPYRSRLGVAQKLSREAWSKAADQVMADAMSKADITLYGDPLPGLNLPRRPLPEGELQTSKHLPRIALAGSVAAILTGAFALLYFLLEPKPEMMSYERHFMLRRLWWSRPVRLLIILLLAAAIAAPLRTLLARGFNPDMIMPGSAGALLAILLILLFWLVPALRGVRETRWFAPVFIAVSQAALLVALAITRV